MTSKPPKIELGEAHEKKGDWAKAAEVYELCVAAAPEERALLKLATVREKLGQSAEAATAYRRVAELHGQSGFAAKAVAALRQAARLQPDDSALALSLAEQLEGQGKLGDAAQVLEGAGRAAALRGDEPARLSLLERLSNLDGSLPLALSLADALARAGRRTEAIGRLHKASLRLGQEGAHADQLSVLERLLTLCPSDRDAALRACKLALLVRQPRRGLLAVRNAMDEHQADAALASAAARALDAMGERVAGTLLHREAARRLERDGDSSAAYDEWRTVLAFDPSDHESLEHMRALSAASPKTTPPPVAVIPPETVRRVVQPSPTPSPLPSPEPEPEPEPDLPQAEPDLQQPQGREPTLEFQLDEVSPARVEIDVSIIPPTATPVPILLPEPLFVVDPAPAKATPASLPSSPALDFPAVAGPFGSVTVGVRPPVPTTATPPAPGPEALPAGSTIETPATTRNVLLLGDGPEMGWIERALADLDVPVERMGRDAMSQALERAEALAPRLVFSPPGLAQVWRESGPWKVAALVAMSRPLARTAVAGEGLEVVPSAPIESTDGLKAAMARFGVPLELVGPFEGPVVVAGTGSPSYHLTLARERLGPNLLAQAALASRTCVLVAGDGREAVSLGAWQETQESGLLLHESPGPGDEEAALALAQRVARVLRLEGLAVIVLGQTGERVCFESLRLQWGPGALAVEERIGQSLPELAANLARGVAIPAGVERRGTALAVLTREKLMSVANLRVEPSPDESESFVCARAGDRPQALRRLLRALGL
ncbi:MAG: hypothetical protein QM765_49810 [Myxococcales bacterium]